MTRIDLERDLAQSYAKTGRYGDIGGAGFSKELAQLAIKNGVASAADIALSKPTRAEQQAGADGRAELHSVMQASHRSGAVSEDDYTSFLSQKAFDPQLLPRERRQAQRELGSLEAGRQKRQAQQDARGPSDDLADKRRGIEKGLRDKYAADPKLRPQTGGKAFQTELHQLYQSGGSDIATDKEGGASGISGFGEALAGAAVLRGVTRSVSSGARGGQVIGQIAAGLLQGVTSAESGLVKVGEAILGGILSPLGKTGSAVTGAAGATGTAIIAALSGAGSLAVAGLKLGGALVGGIVGGVTGGAGAIVGAVIGGLAGGGAGALVGAGLGASVVSFLIGSVSSVVTNLGGALGQALGGIGDAAGKLLGSIGDGLGSVKAVLTDLIQTGNAFAQATLSVSRTGNLPLGAAGGVSSLASLLTGSPGGLSGIFSGFAEMSQYRGTRLAAFGVPGTNGQDPLGQFQAAGAAYQGMDAIHRQMLVQGAFGGNEAVGNLFQLNADQPGSGILSRVIKTARDTALSPQETLQNANLSLDLSEAQSQLDRLKTKLLTDLMPALTSGLGLATKFFQANQGKIIGGLEKIGEFLYVRFPTLLQQGLNAVLTFGQEFAGVLPKVFGVAQQLLIGLVTFTQNIAKNVGKAPLAHQILGDDAANALTAYGNTPLSKLGLTSPEQDRQLAIAARRRQQAANVDNTLGTFNEQGVLVDGAVAAATKKKLLSEADAADKAAAAAAPGLAAVTGFSQGVQRAIAGQQHTLNRAFDQNGLGAAGEAARQKSYLHYLHGFQNTDRKETPAQAQRRAEQGAGFLQSLGMNTNQLALTITLKEHPDALMKMTKMVATQQIRAIQRGGS